MRSIRSGFAAIHVGAGLLASAASPASAQAQSEDWPCVQRLVPKLEAGQMWVGPPLQPVDQPLPELQELVRKLIDPKLAMETVTAEVASFAARQPEAERAPAMGGLFALSLDWLNDERAAVIRGVEGFARGQKALADKIVAETRELQKLQAAGGADAGAIQQLETARQWETRIYTDRQKSLSLVCDQPVQLEQRAFALARTIQDHLR